MINDELKKSVFLSLAGKYSHYAMQLISLMILARVFSISDFGIVAILTVLATFFMLIGEFGLGPALISKENIYPKLRESSFLLSAILGLIVFFIFSFLGPLIASFYNQPAYTYLVLLTAASVLFYSTSTVPLASLQKDSMFIHIGFSEVCSEIITLSVILIFWLYFPNFSLIILASKPLCYSFFRFLFLYFFCKNTKTGRPRFSFKFDLSSLRSIYAFSKYQFASNFFVYVSRNLDNILVGKYFSVDTLAIYEKSYQIMRYPLQLLSFAFTPAIQPVLTKIRNDKTEFTSAYSYFSIRLSIIAGFSSVIFYFLADYIVLIILGKKWLDVSEYLKIFAISLPFQIVLSSTGAFFQAANKPDLLFKCTLFSVVTNTFSIVSGIYSGDIIFLCYAICCSFYLNYLQCNYALLRFVLNEFNVYVVLPVVITTLSSAAILLCILYI
jgi:PST family polysaccharide transporter